MDKKESCFNESSLVSISEASQNFSKVTHLVDQCGSAIITKNNAPRYVILEFNQADEIQAASTDDVISVSKKLLKRNRAVYEELSK